MPTLQDHKPPRKNAAKGGKRTRTRAKVSREAGKRAARPTTQAERGRPLIALDLGKPWLDRLDALLEPMAMETRTTAARALARDAIDRMTLQLAERAQTPPMGPLRRIRCGLALACGMVPPAKVARIGRILASRDGAKPGRKG